MDTSPFSSATEIDAVTIWSTVSRRLGPGLRRSPSSGDRHNRRMRESARRDTVHRILLLRTLYRKDGDDVGGPPRRQRATAHDPRAGPMVALARESRADRGDGGRGDASMGRRPGAGREAD